MPRSHHRRSLALAAVTVIGVATVGVIAATTRPARSSKVEVSAPGTPVSTSDPASSESPTAYAPTTTSVAGTTTTAEQSAASVPITSPAETAVVGTPSGTAAASGPPVDGTYFGVEDFALFDGRCAFLDHHIVGTFSAAGATWDFHQDYCGTLQGDLWSGDGTFALTAPDGAAITGTVTEHNIRVPSPGVPYTLVITDGTQRFVGATGSCRMDNHLRQIQFGLQDDYGSFTCNIAI